MKTMFNRGSTDPLTHRVDRLTQYALGQLYIERYVPLMAAALFSIGLYFAASFSGIWERFGDPWRLIGLIITSYFIGITTLTLRRQRRPDISTARRRVETDAGQAHRPIDVLHDTPAISSDMWPNHLYHARKQAESLRRTRLRPTLAPKDPYYLRFVMPVIVICALFIGFGDNLERLRRAFSPIWQSGISANDTHFDAWVNPPEYTGRPPVYFKNKKTLSVPEGSELVARISGSKDATRLRLKTDKHSRYLKLNRLGPESFETRTLLKDSGTARWRIGARRQSWDLIVLPDRAPQVSFNADPKADKRDRLELKYSFEDDYGVEGFELVMQLLGDSASESSVQLPLRGRSVKREDFAQAQIDMTKHIWTGRKVSARLRVTDGRGQSGMSAIKYFTLPDKIFIEPLAKAIVEQRTLVIMGDDEYAPEPQYTEAQKAKLPLYDQFQPNVRLNRAPQELQRAVQLLEAITDAPAGLYEDPAVYMGLKAAERRLRYARSQDDLLGLADDLWAIALRAEFGTLGTALEEMREAERNLRDGLARRVPQREVDTLFERYDLAVERYMEELRRKALEDGNFAEGGDGGGQGGGRNMDEIEALLKAIEEANRQGDVEGARKALAKLAELLENTQIEIQLGQGGAGGESMQGEMSEEMREALEEMADLLGEQRELKDETEQAEDRQAESELQGAGSGLGGDSNEEGETGQGERGETVLTPRELAERQRALQEGLEALAESVPDLSAQADTGQPGGSGEEGETGGVGQGEDQEGRGGDDDPSDLGEQSGGGTDGSQGETGGGVGLSPEEALRAARGAMQSSRDALRREDFAAANEAQDEAIDALREAARALADQGNPSNAQQAEAGEGEGNNPLGTENGGQNDDNFDADIDGIDNAERARQLLEELRRRAAEQDRAPSERDYLERLLKRF